MLFMNNNNNNNKFNISISYNIFTGCPIGYTNLNSILCNKMKFVLKQKKKTIIINKIIINKINKN